MRVTMTVNGEEQTADCWEGESLLFALREKLGFPGSKNACEQGECGSCSVLLDGKLVCACLVLAAQADGHAVTTVEGLASDGKLTAMQDAFWAKHGLQCGFCTPGMMFAAYEILRNNANPTAEQIRHGLEGNLCRCTGYQNIVRAVQSAAAAMGGRS